jgi:hypothetical protein
MSSDIEADFAKGLRAAAESAAQPAPAGLYVGAVGRGRRIRRTAIVKRSLAGVATLGVVAAVGIPLLNSSSGTASIGAAASSTAKAKPKAGPSSARKPAAPLLSTDAMPAYMEQTLKSLVPAGSSWTQEESLGNVPFEVYAPQVQEPGGQSLAVVMADLETPNGKGTITFSVGKGVASLDCPSKAIAPHDICTKTPLDGGTFYADESYKNYVNATGASIWTLAWNGPDGQSLYLGESTDGPAQALTTQQAEALFTASAWDPVWKSLPATCKFGVMPDPKATEAQLVKEGSAWVCAPTRADAMHFS